MENQMNKTELIIELTKHNVDFSKDAMVAELRTLYAEHIGRTANAPNTSETDNGGKNENEGVDADDDGQQELDDILLRIPMTETQKKLHEMKIEEDLVDTKLRLMEKKKRLFDLETSMIEPIARQFMGPSYKDIKHLVPFFSGSEEYDARKWLSDFERACDSVNANELARLKFFRQSMKSESDGELFLRTDTSATYSEIRDNFIANFGHVYSVSEIIDRLRKITFRSAKTSVMGYILKMQEIAARGNIDEKHIVQFIIDGFENKSAHIAILYPAQTIAQLKELSHR